MDLIHKINSILLSSSTNRSVITRDDCADALIFIVSIRSA